MLYHLKMFEVLTAMIFLYKAITMIIMVILLLSQILRKFQLSLCTVSASVSLILIAFSQ